MTNRNFKTLAAGLALSLLSFPALAQETGMTLMERELGRLMKIWPGDYDNQEQVSFDATARKKSDPKPKYDDARVHALVHPVSISKLGDNLLYVEERIDDDPEKVSYQRLYALLPDEEEKAIRVKTYTLKSLERFQARGRDLSAIADIKARHAVYQEGCDMLLRRDALAHAGGTAPGACAAEDGGYVKRKLRISDDGYTIKHAITDKAGTVTQATAQGSWRKMERARWFTCMIDVPKKTNRPTHTQHYITIHDQGGTFPFTHPDGRDMTLLMRNTWSYGMERETFFIGVLDGDVTGQTLVYGWGQPGQDRIGVNPGWVRIQCDLDTPENVALQKGLREDS